MSDRDRPFEDAIQEQIASGDPMGTTLESHQRDIDNGCHNCPTCGQFHHPEDQGLIGRLRLYLREVVRQRDELASAPVEPPVLSRAFFDKHIALLGTQSWGAVFAQEKLRDAILESLSQEGK
jgi:hypothetical protein